MRGDKYTISLWAFDKEGRYSYHRIHTTDWLHIALLVSLMHWIAGAHFKVEVIGK